MRYIHILWGFELFCPCPIVLLCNITNQERQVDLHMSVTFHIPASPLSTYINCMWYIEGALPYPHLKILPMPSLHVMFSFGDAFPVYKSDQARPFATCAESWSVGLWNTYHIMDAPHSAQVLNVSFKPGGAYPFLKLPLSELHNLIVPLDALWGRWAEEIRERLYAEPTIQARFALLERLLLTQLCDAPHGLNVVQAAVAVIARQHGMLSIRGLCDQIGISQKHLITQFKRMVGGTPKEVARLDRFKRILQSIEPTKPVDWSMIAHQHRYYDQSHFNKDFEAFSGHSPTEYLRLRRQEPDPARHPSRLPTG
jgi:AraC-like DNA-binding protein